MPDITALRERAIALAGRRSRVAESLALLGSVRLTLTPAMLLHSAPGTWDDDEEEDDERLRGRVGESHPLFSTQALFAMFGHGDFTDGATRTEVLNAVYRIEQIGILTSDIPDIERGPEPDLSTLTRFEVVAMVEAYKRTVSAQTESLRDVHAAVTRLRETKSRLPDYVKGSCMGMFGRPDHQTRHVYTEGDFALYNTRDVPIPPGERGHRDGPASTRRVDDHPRVFSARYLAPFLGDETAQAVEDALVAIGDASHPRPGEPSPPRFESSRDRQPVEIVYEPGEIDVDDVQDASPRP